MEDTFAEDIGSLHAAAPEILARLAPAHGETAELFAERTYREQLIVRYEPRRTRRAQWDHRSDVQEGTGLRILANGSSRCASVDGLDPVPVRIEADELGGGRCASRSAGGSDARGSLALAPDRAECVTLAEKRSLLQACLDAALSLKPDLPCLEVTFQGSSRCTYVASSDEPPTLSARSLVGIRAASTCEIDGRSVSIYAVGGGRGGIGLFLTNRPESVARSCIERLEAVLSARPVAGRLDRMPVIVEGGWGAVWLHEAIGHLLEADTPGPYSPARIGDRVAAEHVTIVDDGTFASGRGTAEFDDEGCAMQRSVLIRNGVLERLMTDRRRAAEQSSPRTGNGRRQDYRSEPLPRMTNLFLENGSSTREDLIADVDRGLYVRMIGSGSVHPHADSFSFDVLEAYLIEGGRLTSPVMGARVSGRPSEMLESIVGIGDDFRIDPTRGICAKAGQRVPVSVGMPTVLLRNLSATRQR